jgi:hypothetical protein
MGVVTREMESQGIIHHFYTTEDGHRWDPDSLCTYAAQQSFHETYLTKP